MLYVGRQLDLRAGTVDISAHAGFVQIKLFVFVFFVQLSLSSRGLHGGAYFSDVSG